MIDWTKSMQHTYEYYVVDPGTWKDVRLLNNVKSSSINRDRDTDTLGSATIDVVDLVGECYIRTYLIAIQNGVKYKIALGTHLVQTPSSSFNSMIREVSMDAYTPLIELKENPLPLGYFLQKGDNIMDSAYMLIRERMRAPVVPTSCSETLQQDFVADTDDTGLSFTKDLILNAKYEFDLDEMGRVLFIPKQDTASLQPVWTYTDDDNSIIYPEISMNHDIYDIPNVIEVTYSGDHFNYSTTVVNDDENSPVSTVNRGRVITHRITNPEVLNNPIKSQIDEYAERALRELSTVEYTVSYTHAYCPVRVGDCVRLNLTRYGLTDIKAKVISQNIKCEPGCPVSEKAVFTTKLWG